MKAILITGAGVYIGFRLVDYLQDKGYRIKALDRFFFGKERFQSLLKNFQVGPIDGYIRFYILKYKETKLQKLKNLLKEDLL